MNAETAPTTEFATFAQTATGVAYANPSTTQSATITFTAYNNAGTRLGSQSITLGPLAHGAANVGPLLGLASFTGLHEDHFDDSDYQLVAEFRGGAGFLFAAAGGPASTTLLVTP